MRLPTSFALLFLYTFTCFTNALPISGQRDVQQFAKRKAPYSVVPVDGGQPVVAPPSTEVVTKESTQTVTEPPQTLAPLTETMLFTTVTTESGIPATIITIAHPPSTTTITQTPASEVSASTSTTFQAVTSLVPTIQTVTFNSTPTLTPYDNGMWHTTYYKPAEPSFSSEASAGAIANETPSTANVETSTLAGIPSSVPYALVLRSKYESKPSNITATGDNTKSGVMAAAKTKPPMPTLPKTSGFINPTQVPAIDLAKHVVPGFGR